MNPMTEPVAHPDWLSEACKEAETLFRLVNEGKIPEKILGWMVATKCRRLLRCIYGSDSKALRAGREALKRDAALMRAAREERL